MLEHSWTNIRWSLNRDIDLLVTFINKSLEQLHDACVSIDLSLAIEPDILWCIALLPDDGFYFIYSLD
jgi:hypothetical protein